MNLLVDWLAEFVELPGSPGELARRLTDIGLEVDQIINYDQQNRGVKTAEVLSRDPHPENPDLWVCEISDGNQEAQVVTAAPRVKSGGTYPWAPPGSKLAVGKVTEEKFSGRESAGMLCSSRELGLTEEARGLLELPETVEPGQSINRVLDLGSPVFELDLTPNRPDCLSHLGVARDLAAAENLDLEDPRPVSLPDGEQPDFEINIEQPEDCWSYIGLPVENITVESAPFAIQKRILKMGLRPLNNVVDITNYTLFEVGHPLHPFDADKLNYPLIIRRAKDGERLKTLDGEKRKLKDKDLVIADEKRPRALAGIMGGATSQVDARTNNLLLEGAFFESSGIRASAGRHKLHTEASHRFERGTDPVNYDRCLARCIELLQSDPAQDEAQLKIKSPVINRAREHSPVQVSFSPASFENTIGYDVADEEMADTFQRLGLNCDRESKPWRVTVPGWRPDLERQEDLIEEIVRLDGYENIPVTYPELSIERSSEPADTRAKAIRNYFVDQGFNENITFSFIHSDHHQFTEGEAPRQITNPLARTQATMRQSILAGLLESLEKNYASGQTNLRLFELGRVFPAEVEAEPQHLGLLIHNQLYREKWDDKNRRFDFYDTKGLLTQLLEQLRYSDYTFEPKKFPGFVADRSAEVRVAGEPVGRVGELEPELLESDCDWPLLGGELDLSALPEPTRREYSPFSTQPPVKRDLDLVVDRTQPVKPLRETIKSEASWLDELVIFDVYSGEPLPEDKKSVSFSLQFRTRRRSLSDSEINEVQEKILEALKEQFGAELRDE